jgi:glycosyltransferase involved in cell wall biosynthesis
MIEAACFCAGETTWAMHARSFLRALQRRVPVALTVLDPNGVPLPADLQSMADHPAPRGNSPCIGIGPIERMRELRGPRRIACVVWETTRLPEFALHVLAEADEVWTPSRWGRDVFIDNGLGAERVRVLPHGVDVERFRPTGQRSRETFRFLCVGKWEERKGVADLVRSFCAEFREDEPVELVMHAFNPWIPRFDLDAAIQSAATGSHARIISSMPVAADSLVDLYASCDAFVLPTRGEGWGMPITEAMACALPVIVTDYSAPADFIDADIAYPIRVEKLIDVHDPFFYPRGVGQWAQPDLDHLRATMRHVFEHRDEAAEKGRRAREAMITRWTWDHAAARACELLGIAAPC